MSSLREDENRTFTCLAAAPSLAWYLNGQRQDSNGSTRLVTAADGGAFAETTGSSSSSSTFVVTARRLDRRLDCSATDPATGRVSNASVLLNVQCERGGLAEGRPPPPFALLPPLPPGGASVPSPGGLPRAPAVLRGVSERAGEGGGDQRGRDGGSHQGTPSPE